MRPLSWINRLLRDRRGNVLAITAASMPLILGGAAMAIDTIQLSVWKRQLQRAADSAAIAGAYAESQGVEADDAVHRDLDENVFPTLSVPEEVVVGPVPGHQRAVRVSLTAQRTVPFMSFFTNTPNTITAEATAALVTEGEFCMISLFDGTSAGIDVSGNSTLSLGCGMKTTSKSDNAVIATGSSSVEASPVAAVGGIEGSNNFVGDTTIQPYAAAQTDPLGHLPDPPAQTNCQDAVTVAPNSSQTLEPGCYEGLTFKGTATLEPGTYYVTGDVDFTSQANVTGEGVTIVLTGPGGEAGDLKINGQAAIDLSAPGADDGEPYPGVLFFRDRRASTIEVKINGGADMAFEGALYFPTTDLFFAGNSGMEVQCMQVVGRILKFRGTTDITNECPEDGAAQAFQQTIVRLVS